MSATGLIVSAVIAGITALTSNKLQNKARKESEEKSLDLAMIARGDKLGSERAQRDLTSKSIGLNREKLGLEKMKTSFDMHQTTKATKATQLANLSTALTNISSKNKNMTDFMLSLYGHAGRTS